MALVDAASEPPDGSFDHALSKRRYQVRRRDGQMWHRELLMTKGSQEVLLQEFPVKHVVGSGRFSRTYLAEVDGFVVESPITWYAATRAWGMSPGYDKAEAIGFERPATQQCLACHAGRTEMADRSVHRLRVIEAPIGCERCHGPGSLHIETHAAAGPTKDTPDYTIVNPARLSRDLAEAVCQQCHLQIAATVFSRGKDPTDFRPGLPLAASRQDYTLAFPDAPMTVVGHVEQMHLAACYRASPKFTCTTCHSPHGEPPPEKVVAHYRGVCLGCHQSGQCTVDANQRQRQSPDNDCVHCHMPKTPTDIPHLAFTHHRIGIHDPADASRRAANAHGPGTLKPFLDLSGLSDADRARSLALAYVDLANQDGDASSREHHQREALRRLADISGAGQGDSAVASSIAAMRLRLGQPGYAPFARAALADPTLAGQERSDALAALATAQFEEGRYADAIATINTLTQSRRESRYWVMLAQIERTRGDVERMKLALDQAVAIDPGLGSVHQQLAEFYRWKNDEGRARYHELRAGP